MAVSLSISSKQGHNPLLKLHYEAAAKMAEKILKETLFNFAGKKDLRRGLKFWPYGMVLNVNAPNLPLSKIKGVKLAQQGQRTYSSSVIKRQDNRGRHYYWVGGTYMGFKKQKETDCYLVNQGYASVTPLQLDCTDYRTVAKLKNSFP